MDMSLGKSSAVTRTTPRALGLSRAVKSCASAARSLQLPSVRFCHAAPRVQTKSSPTTRMTAAQAARRARLKLAALPAVQRPTRARRRQPAARAPRGPRQGA
eukprot:3481890-Prymnesium_polylepis.1